MIPLGDNIKSRTWPLVNLMLIGMNLAVFWKELQIPPAQMESFMRQWAVVPVDLLSDPWSKWPTVFYSMFLHGGWAHIIGNMLYLWIFGDNVEDRLGHGRYFIFYFLVGASAVLAQSYLSTSSLVPMIGASGAIAGVLGAYFVLYPKAQVTTLIPLWIFLRVADVPAFFFLGFWFLLQAFQSYGSVIQGPAKGDLGGVAWGAHAGGFLAGLILVWFFKKRR